MAMNTNTQNSTLQSKWRANSSPCSWTQKTPTWDYSTKQ